MSVLKANLDQQKKALPRKKIISKSCPTQRQVKLVWCANQLTGFYIKDKYCKVKD